MLFYSPRGSSNISIPADESQPDEITNAFAFYYLVASMRVSKVDTESCQKANAELEILDHLSITSIGVVSGQTNLDSTTYGSAYYQNAQSVQMRKSRSFRNLKARSEFECNA